MADATEAARRELLREINAHPDDRESLEAIHGQVWDTAELAHDFEVLGFAAPFVVAIRKSDRVTGSLQFQHHPRFYYAFRPA
jgi:hypothetical protein